MNQTQFWAGAFIIFLILFSSSFAQGEPVVKLAISVGPPYLHKVVVWGEGFSSDLVHIERFGLK